MRGGLGLDLGRLDVRDEAEITDERAREGRKGEGRAGQKREGMEGKGRAGQGGNGRKERAGQGRRWRENVKDGRRRKDVPVRW